MSLNTPGSYAWSIISKPGWILASKSSGTVGSATDSLTLSADASQTAVGSQVGIVRFQTTVGAQTVTRDVSVTALRDERRLIASSTGVSLAKTLAWSRLTKTITVRDNFGSGTWTAVSDKGWLSVTSSGSSGGNLVLTANTTGVSTDTYQVAKVTITSGQSAISETVYVGIWNGSTTPTGLTRVGLSAASNLIVDPVRPLAYVTDGGNTIRVFNVYSATQVSTITINGTALGGMDVSPDGQHLYALSNSSQIVDIDLNTRLQSGAIWTIPADKTPAYLVQYLRPNGTGIVTTGGNSYGAAFLASSGVLLTNSNNFLFSGSVVTTPTQNYALTFAATYAIDYSAANPNAFSISYVGFPGLACSGAGDDVAITADGTITIAGCVWSGPGYSFPRASFPASTILTAIPGSAYPNNAETASDGRIWLGANFGADDADVWVYRSDFTLAGTFKVAPSWGANLLPRQLKVSGDGLIGLGLYQSSGIAFMPLAPEGTSSSSSSSSSAAITGVRSGLRLIKAP